MADALDGGKRVGKVWFVLTAIVVGAIAIWVFLVPERKARKPIGLIISQIEHGDRVEKTAAIRGLFGAGVEPGEFAQVFPRLVRALQDEAEMVRYAAAEVMGNRVVLVDQKACPEAATALTALLDDPSPSLRTRAAWTLSLIAHRGNLDVPPPRLVACLDDEAEQVRVNASEALIEYRHGPERLVPVALRRIPTESPRALNAFTDVFWHIRLEPSVLPLLIEGLSSENTDVCLSCTAAINHMGRDAGPALPAILTLLRKELETPHSPDVHRGLSIIEMAAGAVGEISPDRDPQPGTVELLCQVLRSAHEVGQGSDSKGPGSPVDSANARKSQHESIQAEAAWSLGIFGRSSAPAVPLLLSTFEATPESSDIARGIIAESLAAIVQGTPDEDRVIASLVKAWKTATKEQKAAIARALRSFGPKADQLVPELRQLPPDKVGSQIRRVRYPRSRHGIPVRE